MPLSLRSKITRMKSETAVVAMKSKRPMGIAEIQRCIPHRFPFLLIDRVEDFEPSRRIVAIKNVSNADPLLQGHFPGRPTLPGVLIVEAAAQAAAILGHVSSPSGLTTCYLTEIQTSRFRQIAVPGDVITFDVCIVRRRAPFFWFEARARVARETIAEVRFSAYMK